MLRLTLSKFAFSVAPKHQTCLYKLLNVSTDATQDVIKDAYFTLAKKFHPDTNPNSTIDPMKFQQIQEAYQTLSSEERRKKYDENNGIVNIGKYGDPSFGDQQSIYEKYASSNPDSIYQKDEGAQVDYFEKQYFKNKDYFKRKVNEDSTWNFSEKLFRKHEPIQEDRKQWTIHQPFADQAYYAHKDELAQDDSFVAQSAKLLVEFKYLWLSMSLVSVGYFVTNYLDEAGKGKQIINDATRLSEGPGYRLKMLPLNIT